jgi:hypothetical protein
MRVGCGITMRRSVIALPKLYAAYKKPLWINSAWQDFSACKEGLVSPFIAVSLA